jgi:hypothetical protein
MDDIKFNPECDLDITGLEWWEVLQRLHRTTRAKGPFGRMNNHELSAEEAMQLIGQHIELKALNPHTRFDWLHGRSLKISFHTKDGRSWIARADLYDRDASTPARVTIAALRQEKADERARRSS